MIGGPSDVVVEANILRAAAPAREAPPQRPPAAPTDTLPRAVPLARATCGRCSRRQSLHRCLRHPRRVRTGSRRWWTNRCSGIPSPNRRPCRPCRRGGTSRAWSRVNRGPSRAQPIRWPDWLPNSRAIRRRSLRRLHRARVPRVNATSGACASPSARVRLRRRRAPPAPAPAPAVEEPQTANADQNLAEMAQRLEAALRRPKAPEPRVPERAHEPAPRHQAPLMERPAPAPEPDTMQEGPAAEPVDATREVPPPPRLAPRNPNAATPNPPAPAPGSTAAPAGNPPQRSVYDSLEQEMASLLGRPKN